MQPTFNRADRQAGDFCDIFKRKVVFISQRDHLGVIRPQVADSLVEQSRQFPPFRDAIWSLITALLRQAVLRRLFQRRCPHTAPPHLVDGGMMSNRQKRLERLYRYDIPRYGGTARQSAGRRRQIEAWEKRRWYIQA